MSTTHVGGAEGLSMPAKKNRAYYDAIQREKLADWKRRHEAAIRALRDVLDSADCLYELASYGSSFFAMYPGAGDALQDAIFDAEKEVCRNGGGAWEVFEEFGRAA